MTVIRAAKDKKSPVIMQTTPGTVKYANLNYFAAMCKVVADAASVPVAIHLDHGDGFDRCVQAMHAGYTSVMIDGSHDTFEDNIALTAFVTKVAALLDIPVEAELGRVGGKEDDSPAVEGKSPYTDPDEAEGFVTRTGCSSLAVGVGTAHGFYVGTPHIEQGVLKEIRSRLEIPLVLHGTSGVPDDQVAEAIRNGICKVNYATELRQAFTCGFMGYMGEKPRLLRPEEARQAQHAGDLRRCGLPHGQPRLHQQGLGACHDPHRHHEPVDRYGLPARGHAQGR